MPEDDRFDSSLFRVNYEKLVSQTPVLVISGIGNASAQVALMPTIKRGKVPIVGSYTNTKAALEPANPMWYSGFCNYNEQAQVAVGFFSEKLKLKAPKVAVVHLDTAGGKEYYDYVSAAVAKFGGTAKSLPLKVTAIDANAQIRDIMESKPDFVTIHGGAQPSVDAHDASVR
jgi:ABC-type branched-subunit amino acid transport system substrate-binding protein